MMGIRICAKKGQINEKNSMKGSLRHQQMFSAQKQSWSTCALPGARDWGQTVHDDISAFSLEQRTISVQ